MSTYIRTLNARARVRSVLLADRCGCRNARTHFGLARAQIEIQDEKGLK